MGSLAVILLLFSSGVLGDLECWMGGCGTKGPGSEPDCSDDANPSLSKQQCPEKYKKCMKLTGYVESKPYRSFACVDGEWVLREMGVDPENGCYDITAKMNENPRAEKKVKDAEVCLCNTPLCNTATKKTVATTIFLFFLSTLVI